MEFPRASSFELRPGGIPSIGREVDSCGGRLGRNGGVPWSLDWGLCPPDPALWSFVPSRSPQESANLATPLGRALPRPESGSRQLLLKPGWSVRLYRAPGSPGIQPPTNGGARKTRKMKGAKTNNDGPKNKNRGARMQNNAQTQKEPRGPNTQNMPNDNTEGSDTQGTKGTRGAQKQQRGVQTRQDRRAPTTPNTGAVKQKEAERQQNAGSENKSKNPRIGVHTQKSPRGPKTANGSTTKKVPA